MSQGSILQRVTQAENYLKSAGEILYGVQIELKSNPDNKLPKTVGHELAQKTQPVTTSKTPIELKTVDENTLLATIEFKGEKLVVTPKRKFNKDTPPFNNFLVDKVLAKMKKKTPGFDYTVNIDIYLIKDIVITGYNEEQIKELTSSFRWTFEKMYQKQNEGVPQQPTEQKPKPQTTGQTRSIDDVRLSFPSEIEDRLSIEDKGDYFQIKPKKFLGSDNFAKVSSAVRGMGGEYISAGKDSHFRIPKKKETA
jgi:hypothetical protein